MKVPGLTRKLKLLASHCGYKSIPALAKAIGTGRSTAYGWGHGVNDREAGTLPDKNKDNILQLMRQCFGEDQSKNRLVELLEGSLEEFETALQIQSATSIRKLIDDEVITDRGRLIRKKESLHLVETDEDERSPKPHDEVRLQEWFRLQFETASNEGFVFGLQQAGLRWRVLSAHLNTDKKFIHLPGLKANGTTTNMRESEQSGLHHFIAIQTSKPIPIEITRYLTDNIELDALGLRFITQFYTDQPETHRGMFLHRVDVQNT